VDEAEDENIPPVNVTVREERTSGEDTVPAPALPPQVDVIVDLDEGGIGAPDDVVSMEERARLQEVESLQQLAEVRVIPSLSILVSS